MVDFENSQYMAVMHPKTFEAPDKDSLDGLNDGDYVKVCAVKGAERFWTKIIAIEGDKIAAEIDNDLVHTHWHGLKCGDLIYFQKKHIYQILNS